MTTWPQQPITDLAEATAQTIKWLQERLYMNKTRLYQMYDLTAEATSGPIISEKRDAPAIRAFNSVLGDKRTMPGQYPEQFELRFLGTQDDETSHIDSILPPQTIATGAAWVEATKGRDQPSLQLAQQNE